ncbi:serine/threonine-protein kinase 11-interacting protein [Coccinella septempunctata]|uniref:serine/threonine-protein kinase 11-interacting protein n=1 Tax=Coccinella septempunctata TaxID=41139 RepID=UPI001D09077C|nr:serine/threonine-protein kinase 11-interacting protein [Coccinella septempunctata]XP_044762419.1 serine/threonine-protein kinase 11-interacting protein [Coccinella septempunctata]
MEVDEIENLALILKANEKAISEGVKKVSLTTHVLEKVNSLVSLQIKQLMINPTCIDVSDQNSTETTKKNVQIIFKMMQNIVHLKLIADIVPIDSTVDISEFRNLQILELHKVDVSKIAGLNSQRLHLQQLICSRDLDSLRGLLEYCGGDYCSKYIWTELKNLVLSYNKLTALDDSLECVPWLSSLDLSHNELTNVDEIGCLNNLKYLNLSFNKLQKVPKFSGQICNRLQILNLGNNFLEDISQLKNLVNICELDLSDNCLIDHSELVSLSHLAALHWLSLVGNPLSYHTRHIQNTCIYLHQNVDPQRFILDFMQLSTSDVKLIGTFHPLMQRSNSDSLSASEGSTKLLTSIERSKKVREVDIEDNKSVDKEPVLLPQSYSSVDHLEVRNHIHNLRETYGESWLNYYKGPIEKDNSINNSQDMSGFTVLDETNSITEEKEPNNENQDETENNIYNTTVDETSEDEDIEVNSEESIYMAKIPGEEEDLFVVFTKDSLTEIDCTTSKERASWVLSTITSCEFIDEDRCTVQINFDTLRKDRKMRIYDLQSEDAERLHNFIAHLIDSREKPALNKVLQCMKCLKQIPKVDDLLASYKEETMRCPDCGSTILVEENIIAGD